MMRWMVLMGCLLWIGCGPKLKVVKEHGEEYQVYWDKDQQKYIQNGYFKSFYENGAKRTEGQYDHGNKIGVWTTWYENGHKKGQMDWVKGNPEGTVYEWYESGQQKNVGHWKNAGRDGLSTWWYANGQKEKEVTYIGGEPNGVWTYWDSTGAIAKKQYWDHGIFLKVDPPDSNAALPGPAG